MTDPKNKYPHWRVALFGDDDFRANLRCFIKYFSWHILYIILTILSIIMYSLFVTVDKVGNFRLYLWFKKKMKSNIFVKILTIIIYITISGLFLGFLILVGYSIIMSPIESLMVISFLLVSLILIFLLEIGMLILASKLSIGKKAGKRMGSEASKTPSIILNSLSKISKKSKVTPGIRRVYGYCPVSIHIEPRWFSDLENKLP